MVVLMENLDVDFTKRFWSFIHEAHYKSIYECNQDKNSIGLQILKVNYIQR